MQEPRKGQPLLLLPKPPGTPQNGGGGGSEVRWARAGWGKVGVGNGLPFPLQEAGGPWQEVW